MDHTDVGLRAVIRALSDVVRPALDPGAQMAKEQLQLSIDYLEFVLTRLPLLHARERLELRQQVEMGEAVAEVAGEMARAAGTAGRVEGAALHSAMTVARETLSDADATQDALRGATARVAEAVAAIVQAAATLEPDARRAIERRVVHASRARIAFERAWYLPLGLDPEPGAVRALDEVMRARS